MNTIPPVARFLRDHHIPHRVFEHTQPIRSLEQAAAERGQQPSQLIRSILFRLSPDTFVMVLTAGPGQLSWSALRAHLGVSRMSMASKEEVLTVTGYRIGTVAPVGLRQPVRLLADEQVFAHEEISFGSGKRDAAIIMRSTDLRAMLGEIEIGKFTA